MEHINRILLSILSLIICKDIFCQQNSLYSKDSTALYFGSKFVPGIGIGLAYGNSGEYFENGLITEMGFGLRYKRVHYVLYFNDFSSKISNSPPKDTAWHKDYIIEGSSVLLGVGYDILNTKHVSLVPLVMVGYNGISGTYKKKYINELSQHALLYLLSLATDFKFNFREVGKKKNIYYNFIRLHSAIQPQYFSKTIGERGGLYSASICIGFNYTPNW